MAESCLCSVQDCDKPILVKSRGLCSTHYHRWKRYGDPLVTKKITNGVALKHYREVVVPYDGDECLLWPFAKDSHGYAQVWLDGRVQYVSRAICVEEHGPAPAGHQAAHLCGNGHIGCVAKTHLSWKTPLDNQADRIIHNTIARGDDSPSAKLKSDEVLEIRRLGKAGAGQLDLAKAYGVSRSLVGMILQRKRWAHL